MAKQQQRKDKVFFIGKEDKHEHGVAFLVHKDIVNTVTECRPFSSRLITIRLRTVPFNITIVQAYPQTSDYDENKIEEFYYQLQNVIAQTPKKDIFVVQGVGMQKWAGMLLETGKAFVDPSAMMTQMRGLRLLEFATFNDLVLANTFGYHKASRRWTWHSPNGQYHNQIDYILVRRRF